MPKILAVVSFLILTNLYFRIPKVVRTRFRYKHVTFEHEAYSKANPDSLNYVLRIFSLCVNLNKLNNPLDAFRKINYTVI